MRTATHFINSAPSDSSRCQQDLRGLRQATRRFQQDEHGGTLIEIALVLPIALLFTFGVILLCLFLSSYSSATYASRTAIRYAQFHGAASLKPCAATDLATIVSAYLTTIPASAVTVTSTWSPDNTVGSRITIKVSLAYVTGLSIAGLGILQIATTATGTIVQ